MLNPIFAAFTALFFFGKSTADVEEKTQHASWIRTIVYLALSFFVGVFFYKTYQVATIKTIINIEGINVSRDSLGNVADTVKDIHMINYFSTSGIDNREVMLFNEGLLNKQELSYIKSSKVDILIVLQNREPYKIIFNPNNKIVRDKHDIPDNIGHSYYVSSVSNTIPSLLPFFYEISDSYEFNNEVGTFYIDISDLKKNPIDFTYTYNSCTYSNGFLIDTLKSIVTQYPPNEYMQTSIFSNYKDKLSSSPTSYCNIFQRSNIINTLNFFTAADISQYNHMVQINTECYLEHFKIDSNIPIDIPKYDENMIVGPVGFVLKGDFLNSLKNSPFIFNVQLPTLANLQLIRSLILTALITALISLFFSNLYYCVRKYAIQFKDEKIVYVNSKKLKYFKSYSYSLLFLFIFLLSYISFLHLFNKQIYVPLWVAHYKIYILLAAIFVISIVSYFFIKGIFEFKSNKKVRSPKQKSKSKEKTKK